MSDPSLDQAVIQTMNELMRASSDCAEFDPAMSAKLASAARDFGRDLGIKLVKPERVDTRAPVEEEQPEDEETQDLLYLLDLQRRAVAAADVPSPSRNKYSWLGLDIWSRW